VTGVPKPAVVLFDVDETLVHTGGSGARSWRAAFEKLYSIPADIGEHSSAGETDPQVVLATFQGVLGRDPAHDELGKLYAQYLLHLAEDIWTSQQYRALPGAELVLVRLVEAGVMLGLVSGAMEGAARTKLMPANLNRFFVFGAYGSDSPDRADLTSLAIDKATRLVDKLTGSGVCRGRHPPRHRGRKGGRGCASRGGERSLFDRRAGSDRLRARARFPRRPFPGPVMASPFCASADSLALLSETDRHVEHDDGQDRDRFDAMSSQEGSMSLSLKKRHPHEEKRRHRASVASQLIRVRRRNVELDRHPQSDGGALHSPTS
jgi:phosphoglycolate phosphatase